MKIHTGSEEALAMSYMRIFLWIAAAKNRLLLTMSINTWYLQEDDSLLVRDG